MICISTGTEIWHKFPVPFI